MKLIKIVSALLGLASMVLAGEAVSAISQGKSLEQRDAAGAYIKPQAPVDVRVKLLGVAVPGQPVDVEIILRPVRAAQAVSADVRTGPGMVTTRRGKAESLSDVSHPLASRQVLTFSPSAEGLHHITVFAKVLVDGHEQSKVVSVPIQVGKSQTRVSKSEAAMGDLNPDGQGGRVRELPGVQTIRSSE